MSMYKHPKSYNDYKFDWDFIFGGLVTKEGDPDKVIARLIQQLGLPQNLDVDYNLYSGSVGSHTDPDKIKRTLNNFGYTSSGTVAYVTNDIVAELRAGYPCLIFGYEHQSVTGWWLWEHTRYSGGHGWLAHGLMYRNRLVTEYSKDGSVSSSYYEIAGPYLLCNMGWRGNLGDGYYLAGVFDMINMPNVTRSEREGYYQYNRMVTGIRKN